MRISATFTNISLAFVLAILSPNQAFAKEPKTNNCATVGGGWLFPVNDFILHGRKAVKRSERTDAYHTCFPGNKENEYKTQKIGMYALRSGNSKDMLVAGDICRSVPKLILSSEVMPRGFRPGVSRKPTPIPLDFKLTTDLYHAWPKFGGRTRRLNTAEYHIMGFLAVRLKQCGSLPRSVEIESIIPHNGPGRYINSYWRKRQKIKVDVRPPDWETIYRGVLHINGENLWLDHEDKQYAAKVVEFVEKRRLRGLAVERAREERFRRGGLAIMLLGFGLSGGVCNQEGASAAAKTQSGCWGY